MRNDGDPFKYNSIDHISHSFQFEATQEILVKKKKT